MAEKKQKEQTASEIRNLVKERIKEAKAADTNFKEFFATLAIEFPNLKENTTYQWWQSVKSQTGTSDKKSATSTKETECPSERLAQLLKKEGSLVEKVRQAQAELTTVRRDVESLWAARQKVTEAATK